MSPSGATTHPQAAGRPPHSTAARRRCSHYTKAHRPPPARGSYTVTRCDQWRGSVSTLFFRATEVNQRETGAAAAAKPGCARLRPLKVGSNERNTDYIELHSRL